MQNQAIKHTVTISEREAFTDHVNDVLSNDYDVKSRFPITSDRIFDEMADGILFCKLINAAVPGKIPPISPQAINLNPTLAYHKMENLNLAISSAKSIGCTVINLRSEFIMEKRQHIVLGLIWQLINIHFSNHINLKQHPEIIVLKKQDQQDDAFKKLGYEQILIRWLNYHIRKSGGALVVKNLGSDLADSEAYGHVLTNVANLHNRFWAKDKNQKATEVIEICRKQKIDTKIKPEDIVSGNTKLNTILCVDLFNSHHGLEFKEIKLVDLPPEPETDESREIRIFKNWINSQGIDEVYVSYLMNDLRDGRVLLKVLDNFKPGTVDWSKRYSNKLSSRIHTIQNCNYALEICKGLDVKLIGIDGVDIVDGKVKLTLGLVWQICKIYWQQRVGKIVDEQLMEWGNSKIPRQHHIKSLKDPSLSNCRFILHIVQSIKPKTVNFDMLKEGSAEEDVISNINYTIACTRKLGAEVMSLWEHIKQSNPKYIGILLAELKYIEKLRAK